MCDVFPDKQAQPANREIRKHLLKCLFFVSEIEVKQKIVIKMEKPERRYEIDWLRIMLIGSVFIFHIGMFFNTFGWHVKNDVQITSLNDTMSFLHIWRMPLLFFISGAGTFLALGNKSLKKYASDRNKRLMLPFLFGIFTLVPIQVYLEKFDQFPSLWNFYTHMFEGAYPEGNMSWHHLWFILYLFFVSICAIPVIKWLRSSKSQSFYKFIDRILSLKGGLMLFVIPILLSQMLLRPYFPESTHAFVDDWAYMAMYFIFFIYGYVFCKSKVFWKNIISQRYLHLGASLVVSIFLFNCGNLITDAYWASYMYGATAVLVGWFVGLTALGFCFKHMRFDSPFRKYANEAIYPFYLLHQPIILLIGFYMKDMEMSVGLKALYLAVSAFTLSVAIYAFLIRPFNFMRLMFGMKTIRKTQPELSSVLKNE